MFDNSFGQAPGTAPNTGGLHFQIDQASHGMAVDGKVLYHSFAKFDVPSGGSATFSGASSIENILARVRPGDQSDISGTIRSTISGANLFLLNPDGIVFNSGAALDLKGAFVATTGDRLILEDGTIYAADPVNDPMATPAAMLTSSPIASYGFLGTPADIQSQGMLATDGESISLVGGDLALGASIIQTSGGGIHLVSVKSSGKVKDASLPGLDLTSQTANLDLSDFTGLGAVSLASGGSLSASDSASNPVGGGRVVVRAGSLSLLGGTIASDSGYGSSGRGIDVDLEMLTVDGGTIQSHTTGTDAGGDITINSDGFAKIINQGKITSTTSNKDAATSVGGSISITTSLFELDRTSPGFFSEITASTTKNSKGDGGDITIDAQEVFVNGNITAQTDGGAGDSGTVMITAHVSGDVMGIVSSKTRGLIPNPLGNSVGNGGDVVIRGGAWTVDGGELKSVAEGLNSGPPQTPGQPGRVDIDVASFDIFNGGEVLALGGRSMPEQLVRVKSDTLTIDGGSIVSRGFGNTGLHAGGIELDTAGLATLSDASIQAFVHFTTNPNTRSGDILINSGELQVGNLSTITAFSFSASTGGDITIETPQATLADQSNILVKTEGSGDAGRITFDGGKLNIGSQAIVSSETTSADADAGDAGTITIHADQLKISEDASVLARSSGPGTAGSIIINSMGDIVLDAGGSINVASSQADAGGITLISGRDLLLSNGSSINAEASNDGGNLELNAGRLIWLTNSSLSAEAGNDGGSIFLRNALFGLLNGSQISANAINGNGGFIQVSTGVFLTNNSSVTASSQFGADGEVRVDALSDLSGTQADLDAALLVSDNQLQERCTIRIPGERSSFILVGRGGLPVMPGRFLPAHQLLPLPE